jgi:hypothetical protein
MGSLLDEEEENQNAEYSVKRNWKQRVQGFYHP